MAEIIGQSKSTVLRLAIRAGLPTLAQQAQRPEGYFASAYENYPAERAALEEASTKVDVGSEERDRE